MINAAISDIPSDMTITMHLCRGNFRSNFVASGGYEPVAELLFNQINVHGYFMEYDSERAGGFEPLRFVPKGKTVVLGLVTSKTGTLESKDDIKRRIDEAAKFIAARSALPVAAMRLRLDRGRQCAGRGRAMGEAADDRRNGRRGVGLISPSPARGKRFKGERIKMSQRTKPPFRADHVGSLLRPAALKQAREQRAKGEIDAAALKAVEDRDIERRHQEAGSRRPAIDHRRRIPPLVVASRFSLGSRRRRAPRHG